MRIIITGGGEVGYALARALATDHEIFVIDHSPEVADRFAALDIGFIHGSATSADVLRRAHVDRADLLIACTGLDEVNFVSCAIAHRSGLPRTICFVSRDDFLREEGDDSMRAHFGIERVVWPEAQLAEDIERIIAAPGAIDAEVFSGGRIRLLEYRLQSGSPLTAGPLAALNVPRRALIVAVKHREAFQIPRGDTRLAAGDKIVVMGTPDALRALQPLIDPSAAPAARRQVVTIIGGGDVGFRLAQRLDSSSDCDVRIFEKERRRGELLAATLRRALVLHGDGTDLELLEGEEIGRSDVLVSVIDNDERNLLASLLARQLGVRKIITRVSRPANLRLFERVGIDVALSARGAAVASVVHQIQGGRANLLAVLEEGQATIVELVVPPGYRPRSLQELDAPPQSIVGAILRGDEVIIPRGADQIRPLDRLLVFATSDSVARIRDFFATAH
ncbi:MAG TPA: Trk system potassium transporter TrkA [Vicinamibacterales bacterium]|nr:Trk system potassium transporter TrkA [Vicinamibacterales bacterium]